MFLSDTTPMLLYANSMASFPTKDPERAMAALLMDVVEDKRKGKLALVK